MLIISDNSFFIAGYQAYLKAYRIKPAHTRIVVDTGAGRHFCILERHELQTPEFTDPISAFFFSRHVSVSPGVDTDNYLILSVTTPERKGVSETRPHIIQQQLLLMQYISEGKSYREIISRLATGGSTVYVRQTALMHRLDMSCTLELRISLIAWYKAWPHLCELRRTLFNNPNQG